MKMIQVIYKNKTIYFRLSELVQLVFNHTDKKEIEVLMKRGETIMIFCISNKFFVPDFGGFISDEKMKLYTFITLEAEELFQE